MLPYVANIHSSSKWHSPGENWPWRKPSSLLSEVLLNPLVSIREQVLGACGTMLLTVSETGEEGERALLLTPRLRDRRTHVSRQVAVS